MSGKNHKLKVLFVSSANRGQVSPIVQSQGNALEKAGVMIDYYGIRGKGLPGYLKNITPLNKHIKINQYDIIHAHYSLSAITATLAGCRPIIVSLMGGDVDLGRALNSLIRISNKLFWSALIVKSKNIADRVGIKDCLIIPNGVDVSHFQPLDKDRSKGKLQWSKNKKCILFASNPNRKVKNYKLLEDAYRLLPHSTKVEIKTLENVPHSNIPMFMNASDVVVLPSFREGSPNVIKEAMACNRPIVATNVGDIAWLFGDMPGHFFTKFDPEDMAIQLMSALQFSEKYGKTKGRNRIIHLGFDSESVSGQILSIYNAINIKNKHK